VAAVAGHLPAGSLGGVSLSPQQRFQRPEHPAQK
jgi:hypothetical protein